MVQNSWNIDFLDLLCLEMSLLLSKLSRPMAVPGIFFFLEGGIAISMQIAIAT